MKAHLLRLFCMPAANLYAHVKEPPLNYVRCHTAPLGAIAHGFPLGGKLTKLGNVTTSKEVRCTCDRI